ncbi:MAG: hypothetical protein GX467_11065 [Rikenellaceae bacterium]|nr:hypothetical protein [Bacteroidales bacterium]NLH57373.1 hypothetical protein [Rikenellaceae bacterium]OQC65317.1 MAG: hypothetical protein BWX49_00029 [Bacteroidetes bacterium ADurb.Bin008]HNV82546.1 hypothetical protein [Tenuifilaceae bacterium]HOF92525.1 hypothetical protein [Tenuifilaceae bacterium]
MEFKDTLMEMNRPSYLLKDTSFWTSIEDKYFRLHISNSITDSEYPHKLQVAQQGVFNHLFKLMEIKEPIDSLPLIDIFIFKDIEEKYSKTQVKSSAHSIPPYYAAYYLTVNAGGAHEIAHILNSHLWCSFSNEQFDMLLNEGFSFYSDEGIIFKFDFYETAKQILKSKKYQINRIISSSAGDSYEKQAFVSGAFVKYLIETYGIEKFGELWLSINKEEADEEVFKVVYNQSISNLESNFYLKVGV